MNTAAISRTLSDLASRYPTDQQAWQQRDAARVAFHLSLLSGLPSGARVADIGGGLGLFSPGAAALGFQSILIDDLNDAGNIPIRDNVLATIHRPNGVEFVQRDVIREGIELPPKSLDAVTSFDSMEHWHHSPKRLFHSLLTALKPGGLFIVNTPNCVNLRKRITVPLGIGDWSLMAHWYEEETFRGHVREPSVANYRYIANDLGLTDYKIIGRNWEGYVSRYGWVRRLTPFADHILRLRPSLCSALYLIGHKPSYATSIALSPMPVSTVSTRARGLSPR